MYKMTLIIAWKKSIIGCRILKKPPCVALWQQFWTFNKLNFKKTRLLASKLKIKIYLHWENLWRVQNFESWGHAQIFNQSAKKCANFSTIFQKKIFFNFSVFQLWLTFAKFKNIWAILENLSCGTKNLNFDICLFLVTFAHHKEFLLDSCLFFLLMHTVVSWLQNYFRNNSIEYCYS